VGQPLVDFRHERPTPAILEDDGLIAATYGDLTIHANLGPRPRQITGLDVAPQGFLARAPGMLAANLHAVGDLEFPDTGLSFVVEANPGGAEAWVYAHPDQEVAILLPQHRSGVLTLAIAGHEQTVTCQNGVVHFRLPTQRSSMPTESDAENVSCLWHIILSDVEN
jgi:hypothetical protein